MVRDQTTCEEQLLVSQGLYNETLNRLVKREGSHVENTKRLRAQHRQVKFWQTQVDLPPTWENLFDERLKEKALEYGTNQKP